MLHTSYHETMLTLKVHKLPISLPSHENDVPKVSLHNSVYFVFLLFDIDATDIFEKYLKC